MHNIEQAVEEFFQRKSYCPDSYKSQVKQKRTHMTITSDSGAGKTELLTNLRNHYPDYEWVSGSEEHRKMREEFGFEENKRAFADFVREHPELGLDRRCDYNLRLAALKHEKLIIEGRLAHLMSGEGDSDCFRVFLDCPLHVRAERRFNQLKKNPGFSHNLVTVMVDLRKRDRNDETRYKDLYPGSMWAPQDYDLVVDTQKLGKEETFRAVVEGYKKYLSSMRVHRPDRNTFDSNILKLAPPDVVGV